MSFTMTKATKRKAREQSTSEGDLETRNTRVAKARKSSLRSAMSFDSGEDPGRLESQQILAMSKQFVQQRDNKKDDFLSNLSERVNKDQTNLMDFIAEKEQKIANDDKAFASKLEKLFAAAMQDSPSGSSTETPTTSNSSHPTLTIITRTLFDHCDSILHSFDATGRAISAIPAPQRSDGDVQQGWQQDRDKVEQLLELGKRVATRRAEKLVKNKTAEDLAEDGDMAEAGHVFRRVEDREEKLGPGEVLHGIERGVKRMTRVFPESDA